VSNHVLIDAFICIACGTQFSPAAEPPERCPICEDERQPVRREGQAWTTMEELRQTSRNEVREQEPGLTGIGTDLLWDCVSRAGLRRAALTGGLGRIASGGARRSW
jgi:hypothetical protein